MPLQISKECQSPPAPHPHSALSLPLCTHTSYLCPGIWLKLALCLTEPAGGQWPTRPRELWGGLSTLPEAPYFLFFFVGSKKALILPHTALPCQGPKRNECSAWVGRGVRRPQTHALKAEEMGGATQGVRSLLPLFLVSIYYASNLFHMVPSSIPAGILSPLR